MQSTEVLPSHQKQSGDDPTTTRGHAPPSSLHSSTLKKAKITAGAPDTTTNHHHKKWGKPTGPEPLSDLCIGGRSYHLQPKPHQQHRGLKRPHAGPASIEGETDRIEGEVDFKVARGESPASHPHSAQPLSVAFEEPVTTKKEVEGCQSEQGSCQGSKDESIIAQCIRRFRDHPALSRAEREKLRSEGEGSCMTRVPRRDDFWWQSPVSSHSTKKGVSDKTTEDEEEEILMAEYMNGSHEGSAEDDEERHIDDKDSITPGAFRHLKSPTKGSLTDEPVSSLTSQDEETWPKDDSMEEVGGEDMSGGHEAHEDDDASSMQQDLHAEQRALECGEGPDSDLDSRAEVLLQKCKSVLKDFYGPESLSPTIRMGRRGKQGGARRYDPMHHKDDEDDYTFSGVGNCEGQSEDEEGSFEDMSRKEEGGGEEVGGGSEGEVGEEEEESVHQSKEEPEERGSPEGRGRQRKEGKAELSGYVDELLDEALNLSLEKPEEAVQRLRVRLGLSHEGSLVHSGASEEDSTDQHTPGAATASLMVPEREDAEKALPAPPPSTVDIVTDMMEMNPLPPLPSPRADPYMDDFSFLPGSPVDSTRATLDSSSTATDVSGDISQGDLRCFEVEGVEMSLKASENDASSSWFEVSSSSGSSSFTTGSSLFLDHRPPSFLLPRPTMHDPSSPPPPRPTGHDASSPPPKASRQPLTISIPQSTEMLRVRRSPSNSPRRRDDCSPYYYVPEATCAIARELVKRTVHRGLFMPCGANFTVRTQEAPPTSTSGVSPEVKGEGKAGEAGNQTPVPVAAREELMETPVAAPSSTNSAMSSLEEGTGAMEVDHGKGREREQGQSSRDDQALIEGHMYDTDPIVHALRRRARELKGLLGVM